MNRDYSPSTRSTRGGGFNGLRRNPGDPPYGKHPLKEKNRPPHPTAPTHRSGWRLFFFKLIFDSSTELPFTHFC